MSDLVWPPFALRITTPRLEIRAPRDSDFPALLAITDDIHDPTSMPFLNPWTDVAREERRLMSVQWWWKQRSAWSVDDWAFCGAVFLDGEPIGVQDLMARNFSTLRSVTSASWIGRQFQGQGLGKEMRSAMLHLAFEGLGANEAHSGGYWDNQPSLRTSYSLGYVDNGTHFALRRGVPDRIVDLRIDRATWSQKRRDDISIFGLDECRFMFERPTKPDNDASKSALP